MYKNSCLILKSASWTTRSRSCAQKQFYFAFRGIFDGTDGMGITNVVLATATTFLYQSCCFSVLKCGKIFFWKWLKFATPLLSRRASFLHHSSSLDGKEEEAPTPTPPKRGGEGGGNAKVFLLLLLHFGRRPFLGIKAPPPPQGLADRRRRTQRAVWGRESKCQTVTEGCSVFLFPLQLHFLTPPKKTQTKNVPLHPIRGLRRPRRPPRSDHCQPHAPGISGKMRERKCFFFVKQIMLQFVGNDSSPPTWRPSWKTRCRRHSFARASLMGEREIRM